MQGTLKPFERAEYLARLRRTQLQMAERGLDLLVVTVPENIYYLSGYSGWSFYTVQGLLVSQDCEEPVLVLRDMDVACAELTTFLSPDGIVGYPEEYIGGDKHPMTFMVQLMRERFGRLRRVGYEANGYFYPVSAHRRMVAALDGVQVVEADGLVNWLRTVKSPAEIAAIRDAAAISSLALETAHGLIEPGVRECDVAAAVTAAHIRGTADFGGSVPTTLSIVAGDRTRAPHISWTDDVLGRNVAVSMEIGGSRFQYHAGLARSWYLGKPPASLTRLADTVVDGLNSALAAMRPGVRCEDVEAAWRCVLDRAGYEKHSRIGYSIGIGFMPNWSDDTASLQRGDTTPLEPGMTFHVICGMWKGADNVVMSETVLVTDHGCDVLTRAPRKLLVKH